MDNLQALFAQPWMDIWAAVTGSGAPDPRLFFPGMLGVCEQVGIIYALYTAYKECEWWYYYHKAYTYWCLLYGSHERLQLERYYRFVGCTIFVWMTGMFGVMMRLIQLMVLRVKHSDQLFGDHSLQRYVVCAIAGFTAFLIFQHLYKWKESQLDTQRKEFQDRMRREQQVRELTGKK